MSNWEKQIQDHVVDDRLTYYTYYGGGRGVSAAELKRYDVVLTTYQTVVGERGGGSAKGGVEMDGAPSKKKAKVVADALFKVFWKASFMALEGPKWRLTAE